MSMTVLLDSAEKLYPAGDRVPDDILFEAPVCRRILQRVGPRHEDVAPRILLRDDEDDRIVGASGQFLPEGKGFVFRVLRIPKIDMEVGRLKVGEPKLPNQKSVDLQVGDPEKEDPSGILGSLDEGNEDGPDVLSVVSPGRPWLLNRFLDQPRGQDREDRREDEDKSHQTVLDLDR